MFITSMPLGDMTLESTDTLVEGKSKELKTPTQTSEPLKLDIVAYNAKGILMLE